MRQPIARLRLWLHVSAPWLKNWLCGTSKNYLWTKIRGFFKNQAASPNREKTASIEKWGKWNTWYNKVPKRRVFKADSKNSFETGKRRFYSWAQEKSSFGWSFWVWWK
ncbi:unnamed protein product [Blepharisma stoltei]|uniref:Uncharacterized protein n=1 Tax=Blepharisma stoltei TaxID=1481888 RepID=A0AAU9JHW1_9CILI|nr:unnamed protein product [Blepharisma stoltei]